MGVKWIRDLVNEEHIMEDTFIVTETAQRIKAARVGDIVDYVVKRAEERLAESAEQRKKSDA